MEARLTEILQEKFQTGLEQATNEQVYYALLTLTKERIKEGPKNEGKRKLYYISAEFLIGKLLSNNLINLGMLEPLSGKLTTDESKFNGVLDQLTAEDGNYYAVPFRSDFWVVYYNKDIFDQAGIEYPTNDMTMADFDAKIREVYDCLLYTSPSPRD